MNFLGIKKYLVKYSRGAEDPEKKEGFSRKAAYIVLGVALGYLAWECMGRIILSRPGYEQFSGFLPAAACKAMIRLAVEEKFWHSVAASLGRVGTGIVIALVLGIPAGLLLGFYRELRLMSHIPMQFLRMISPLAWMPIALFLFQGFESAICFLVATATVWPIIMNTVLGVSRVNPGWMKMARNQGATNRQLILHILAPASTPYILTSLRLALGMAWIVIVPAEFLGVSSGLGYLINDARDTMEYDRLMAVVLAVGVIGFVLDASIQFIQRLFRWT